MATSTPYAVSSLVVAAVWEVAPASRESEVLTWEGALRGVLPRAI